ncbi:hypothetical protein BDZ94DRAFT_1322751 [Collybia nuda]|uniref:F-box domain-containing protein n=1 Tax=Collybia nuda TaxID=64659 RepID=A0A9P5Y4Q4_9AGAR|nr:hypothetical protein BDZ94DRAFT_1322751 [Collybia nuda]
MKSQPVDNDRTIDVGNMGELQVATRQGSRGQGINRDTPKTISILPTEIISSIFRACAHGLQVHLPISYDSSTVTIPWVLGQVCKSWKEISDNEASLWSSLTLSYNRVRDKRAFTQRVKDTIFPRTKLEQISITCLGFEDTDRIDSSDIHGPVLMLIMPNLGRFRDLSLSLTATELKPLVASPPGLCTLLESVQLEYLRSSRDGARDVEIGHLPLVAFDRAPMLRKLYLKCHFPCRFIGEDPLSLPWSQLMELDIDIGLPYHSVINFLPLCTQLVHFHIYLTGTANPGSESYIVLPRLRSISLFSYSSHAYSKILGVLTLPALRELRLSLHSFDTISIQNTMLTLLVRSECTLELFTLMSPYVNPIDDMSVLLEAMPRLRKLYIHYHIPLTIHVLQRMIANELVPLLEGMHCSVASIPMAQELIAIRKAGSSSDPLDTYHGIQCALLSPYHIASKCKCNVEGFYTFARYGRRNTSD